MSKTGQVGYESLRSLHVGDRLEYLAGMEGHRVDALVTVSRDPSTTGVYVCIDTILSKGELSPRREGEEIIAGALELFR